MRRNAIAVAEIADACAAAAADLVLVSTNEVFDGRRIDGHGYAATDRPSPGNPYGASKLAGEAAAQAAFLRRGGAVSTPVDAAPPSAPQLAVVRTAWLFGPPGNDFPARILAAAERARAAGQPLRVVSDEIGSPTYAPDLAEAIVELLGAGSFAGVHHVVNGGTVSRAAWARAVLAGLGLDIAMEEISLAAWERPSAVPPWAVLEPTPLPSGELLRPWEAALADYLPMLRRGRAVGGRA
jgi:dTDP-4-dehydrorhamnose reductase